MTTMAQNPSTSNGLCVCGCGASVKPGQRWREPACKVRAYRAQQLAYQEQLRDEVWDRVDKYLQLEEERDNLACQLEQVAEAYRQLQEEHQHCPPAPRQGRPGAWSPKELLRQAEFADIYAVLGVRPDAEWAAIEGAYHGLVKAYHPDYHPEDCAKATRMSEITRAYRLVARLRGMRR
jgi:DnaJ domain